jgi:sugar O-acyltransferase (sialic acid O-acetyltransferase NeuD family)
MKEKIILIGGGGHCKACIDVIEQAGVFQIAGIVDMTEKMHQKIFGYEIIATDSNLPDLAKEYHQFLITLGQVKSPSRRIELFETIKEIGAHFPTILSPHAYISKHAQIGEGTIVMHHALINAGAKIGNNCIINNKALIEHDAIIGNHCHIATGAVINGGVRVGSGTFFGSNSVTKEFIDIGRNSIIGCGAKIIKNVPPNSLSFDH